MVSSDASGLFFFGVGTLVGVGLYYYGLGLYHTNKLIQYTPTSKAASVAPGICEVQGTAKPYGELKISPYNRKACVFYETTIYRWSGSGKNRSRNVVKVTRSQDPFFIHDDTGDVLIRAPVSGTIGAFKGLNYLKRDINASAVPSNASVWGAISNVFALVKGQKPKPAAEPAPDSDKGRMRALLQAEYPSLVDYGDRIDVEETYIEPGDPIYVLGTAKAGREGDPDSVFVGYDQTDHIFCISDGSEKEALKKTGSGAYLYSLLGPLVFAICGVMFFGMMLGGVDNPTSGLILIIGMLMYAGFVLTNFFELYNGTIRLRQNIERAKANVDALMQMRHELVPNLVEVVSAAAKYEKKLQTEVANLRAMQLDDAGKSVIALAESYPALQANKNFITLQMQLAEIQEKLAGSQSYVVDATTLYNTRVQSFPYFLFTSFIGLRPLPMPALV